MSEIDPGNPVVRLCQEGMAAEGRGDPGEARRLFLAAWDASADDYEACIAAHYVARHQAAPDDARRWNQTALDRADAVGDDRVAGFYPSLLLNMGRSHEDAGDTALAVEHYTRARDALEAVPDGPYRAMVAGGIGEALARLAPGAPS